MYFSFSCLLIMKTCGFIEGFSLLPIGNTYVCPDDQPSYTCITEANFLEWNITIPSRMYVGLRLISSIGVQEIQPLIAGYTVFRFSRESNTLLNITLSISNMTADLLISCVEYRSPKNTLQSAAIYISMSNIDIEFAIAEQSFEEAQLTVMLTLQTQNQYSVIYGVFLTSDSEFRKVRSSKNMSIQFALCYNTQYNLSTFAMLCGKEIQSTPVSLFFAKCGEPSTPQYGYTNPYTSTMEGTHVIITCLSEIQEENFTTICTESGNWIPDPANICSNTSEPYNNIHTAEPELPKLNHTTSDHDSTLPTLNDDPIKKLNSIIAVVISLSATGLAIVTALIVACGLIVLKSRLSQHRSSCTPAHLSSLQAIPVYETIYPMEFQESDLELVDNVAYGPLHPSTANIG